MKQLIKNNKTGELSVREVPVPNLPPNHILVRNHYSAVSIGTESSSVDMAKKNLIQKARSRPEEFKKVLKMMEREGVLSTYRKVMNKLEMPAPLGYSSAGTVLKTGKGATGFQPGDRVACGGCGHAEVIAVPSTLCAKVPNEVQFEEAAFTTIGAIAMQGVRQAGVKLGENVVVIGLGIVGQITLQLVAAAGGNPVGVDIDDDIVDLSVKLGFKALKRSEKSIENRIKALTGGYGADSVIITAGTSSNDPVEFGSRIARDKGTVTVVGAVSMDLPREPFYMKELSFNLSRSYGPGRYDVNYEEKARDYPIGFVRWTENRNMEAFLNLLTKGRLNISPLITDRFDFSEAPAAYEKIKTADEPVIGALLEYDNEAETKTRLKLSSSRKKATSELMKIGFIGAGSYAQKFLLSNLEKKKDVAFIGLATGTGMNAEHLGKKYDFEYVTTDAKEIIEDDSINCVFIATRHDLHAEFVTGALKANKHVFVEKPLAIREEELREIESAWKDSAGSLMVGFNRRYSPLVEKAKMFFQNSVEPVAINYRINAGAIPADHWIQDPEVGGGRIVGEVCHFVDLCVFLAGSAVERISAERMGGTESKSHEEDTLVISVRHQDGSISSISYFSNGDSSLPKERIEIFCESSCVIIDDFIRAQFLNGGKSRKIKLRRQDKGQSNQIKKYVEMVKTGEPLIPPEDLFSVTQRTFEI